MDKQSIRLVIADDHKIFRDGLKLLFRKQNYITLVGEASNGMELVDIVKIEKPSIVITDIKMPRMDGIEATRLILEFDPNVLVIAMSMSDEESMVLEMIEVGAKGYLLKDADKSEILSAIDFVINDKPYYSHSIYSIITNLSRVRQNNISNPLPCFSEKEIEIIRLICKEMTSKEIGEQLFYNYKTIEWHRAKIMDKMNVKSTIGLVVYAIRNKIVDV